MAHRQEGGPSSRAHDALRSGMAPAERGHDDELQAPIQGATNEWEMVMAMILSRVAVHFSPRGRATRSEFSLSTLWIAILMVTGGVMAILWSKGLIPAAVMEISGLWMNLCVCARRLHDLGRSGWWRLVSLVPFANAALGLYLLFAPGQAFPNRFGPVNAESSNGK